MSQDADKNEDSSNDDREQRVARARAKVLKEKEKILGAAGITGKAQPNKQKKPRLPAVQEKWGLAGASFTQVPNILLENKLRLEISDGELVILLLLIKHWWYGSQEKLPFPSTKSLADKTGKNVRQVQRLLTSLETNPAPVVNGWSEEPGYIQRIARMNKSGRQQSNQFDMAKLKNSFSFLLEEQEAAKAKIAERKPRSIQKKPGATHRALKDSDYF